MTFDDIKNANTEMKTVEVKDKEYVQVNQRVLAFRQLFPMGKIETQIINLDDKVVLIQATATDENGKVLATGHAFEEKASSFINKSSYVENCETSAVGRCLGFLGIGIDASICSKEDLENAKLNQNKKEEKPAEKKPTEYITKLNPNAEADRIDRVLILTEEFNVDVKSLLMAYKETDINKIDIRKLDNAIEIKRNGKRA